MTPIDSPEPSDEELVRQILADPDARGSRSAASEVLLSAWRALPSFGGRSRFTSWLFVIARNRCFNAVAARSPLRDDDVEIDALPSGALAPDEQWEQWRDEEAMRRLMMEHLDEQERGALWMRCFERLSVDDVTRALHLDGASGARALLQRARRKLRAALDQRPGKGT